MPGKGSHPLCQVIVISNDTTSVTKSSQVVSRVEGKSSRIAKSANKSAFVFRQVRVSAILNYPKVVVSRNRHNWIHVAGLAKEMAGNDTNGSRGDLCLDQVRIDRE